MRETATSLQRLLDDFSRRLVFYVNDDKITLEHVNPRTLLADWLRENGYTGTKIGCGQGGCGACTVLLTSFEAHQGTLQPVQRVINACMRPLCSLDGMQVTTVEYLGSVKSAIDPIQERITIHEGTQCGYCTPGFVMNMYGNRLNNPAFTRQDVEDRFDGNLCRCTGYRAILYAMGTLATDPPDNKQLTCEPPPESGMQVQEKQHVIPPDLERMRGRALHFRYGDVQWFRPTTLSQVHTLKQAYHDAPGGFKLVVGNTSIGIYDENPSVYVDISLIPELHIEQLDSNGLTVGSAVTLSHLMQLFDDLIESEPAGITTGFKAMRKHMQRVANVMVRNAGSIAGNLMLVKNHEEPGSDTPFPSDIFLMLTTLGGSVTLGSRYVKGDATTYPILELPPVSEWPDDALLLSVHIPFSEPGDYVRSYKVTRRWQNAHAIVNAGFYVNFNESQVVTDARIVYGGLQRTPVRVVDAEDTLRGSTWNESTLRDALAVIEAAVYKMPLYYTDEGYTDTYRRELATTTFYSFFVSVALAIDPDSVQPDNVSAGLEVLRPLSTGRQEFPQYPDEAPINEPIMKYSGFLQATGEAIYTRDIPLPAGGYEAAFVYSDRAKARFHYEPDLQTVKHHLKQQFHGFVAYITADDITQRQNATGSGSEDLIFAPGKVTSYGQQIGLVVARTDDDARAIVRHITENYIIYDDEPAILTIQQAIEQNSFFPEESPSHLYGVKRPGSDTTWLNDPKNPLETGDTVVSGKQSGGSQAHFYMEPQITLAVPQEGRQILIHSSTQDAATVQRSVATALNYETHDVTVEVKRLGGGFGGKETRPPLIACAAAIAADHLNRPVRLALSREDDMKSIGKRHDIFSDYSLSVSENGQIHGWKQHFYTDGGCTVDVSQAVMDLILLSADNAYNVPTYFVQGDVCRTNKASNTAMRSFGVVQMMVAIEEAVEKAAYTLGMRPETLREQNFYAREGDFAPYGAPLHECLVGGIWQKLKISSNFEERVQDIETFNQNNRWRKRGISMMPLKYGVSYTYDTLDQGAALLNVYYDDGTILLQHGGVEMGQGIHTKMGQIAASQLNVPFEKIRVGKNDTDVLPNTSSTGASTGTDLNGGAVIKAAQKLRTRLEHYIQGLRDEHGDEWCVENGVNYWNYEAGWRATVQVNRKNVLMWDNIVQMAYNDRIDLSSHGFFRYEHLTPVDEANPYGTPFFYYNYAACCSEVEINVLTGDFTILRTDILYDTGKSVNPCVDIGQIEGGFVQGIGYVTTEELIFNEAGQLVTDNTWTYKPPGSKTIPVDFRVALNRSRRKAIHSGDDVDTDGVKSSKTTGEPPLVLATTVFFAIKHAVLAARHDQGVTGWFNFPAPATTQAIQQACLVNSENMNL